MCARGQRVARARPRRGCGIVASCLLLSAAAAVAAALRGLAADGVNARVTLFREKWKEYACVYKGLCGMAFLTSGGELQSSINNSRGDDGRIVPRMI